MDDPTEATGDPHESTADVPVDPVTSELESEQRHVAQDEAAEGEAVHREETVGGALYAQILEALTRVTREGGHDNRWVIQGDRGYIAVRGELGEDDLVIKAAAGRSLDRLLAEDEVKRLYEAGFRRKNAASAFERIITIEHEAQRAQLTRELLDLLSDLYTSSLSEVTCSERLGDRVSLHPKRLTDAMKRLSVKRDMSSRQKVYWAVIRAEVLLALSEPPPVSLTRERGRTQWVEAGQNQIADISSSVKLKTFKDVTGYQSVAIFSDLDAYEATDPRGINWVQLPGKLAIALVLAQGWDSLLINPHNAVGGELYRNELTSIMDGLSQLGW